jgi:hypothetical protein
MDESLEIAAVAEHRSKEIQTGLEGCIRFNHLNTVQDADFVLVKKRVLDGVLK